MKKRIVWMLVAGLLAAGPIAAKAAVVFDNCLVSGCTILSTRTAESSPGALLNVAANITINQIAVKNNLDIDGNLKFLIFDHLTHTLLFSTAPKFFADDGLSYKLSNTFSFTLLAGGQYDVGAISDVAGLWAFDILSDSQNGITSVVSNPQFSNFASPTAGNHAAADGAIQLFQADVPEPSMLLLFGVALAVLAGSRRRGRISSMTV